MPQKSEIMQLYDRDYIKKYILSLLLPLPLPSLACALSFSQIIFKKIKTSKISSNITKMNKMKKQNKCWQRYQAMELPSTSIGILIGSDTLKKHYIVK